MDWQNTLSLQPVTRDRRPHAANDYNYAVFNLQAELGKFEEFENLPLHAGRRAPDFPAEDLETAQTVNLKDLWSGSLLIIEFGSYT